ncbi:8-oxoguanine deaminase [Herbaspirillum sp.]|jgi:8-oxoguanine deaminase|uniref:8-oxoguanine deaminase n=1 Tax=Herbaspirillum TaxID=963 RepID=UPI00258E6EF0|nr:8-oxoguanine deaminase [Herbaspirillum sp.]MCP3656667.1 8-oxoguanine deaminase [Herbaspirillum sp.]MCP3948343.1 8-oxoguanine deaminase [Herbaspirillum sp.]MCP4029850.1 8-oxoguanine deaminase [Herbaspirillum sp.]MCP4555235.1 8-oxoguanine deaminase [Herbaspirillum sp.]
MQEQATGKTLLIRNARVLVTMNEGREEIADGALYIRGKVIEQVGKTEDLPQEADEVIDASHHVVIPGLINTHHHMYQSLTRAIPSAQNGELFNWLTNLYPIWAGLTPEMIRVSTLTAMAELILSGCTTSSDHLYIYPNQTRLDDSLEAAAQIGMRFHGARGAMSVGQSKGGLPPDRVVEEEPAILKDTQRLIETYHDSQRHAMQRIVVAPCSPFSVSRDLMREAADLARHYGVSLHTHLAENVNDIAYSREKFNMTPAEYAEDCGWVGHDVWHAHCVQLDEHGINLFARTGTGVAHCPCSNMRLASGIAPLRKMLDAGVPVGLGVDGSASNDSAHMLGEVRQAMLLQRVGFGPDAMTARQALEVATLGGAKVLNRDDIGALKPGMSADVVMFDTRQIAFAGALHDPVAALVFCTPANVNTSIINGRVIVREGQLTTIDLGAVLERHNHLAYQLAEAAG